MDSFNRLHTVLSSLRESAEAIVKTAISVLETLEQEENELVESILDELASPISEAKVINGIVKYIKTVSQDANSVLEDLDEFASLMVQGEEALEKAESNFFQTVWFGDMYDCSGVAGLESLLEELQGQKDSLNTDVVVKEVSNSIENPT